MTEPKKLHPLEHGFDVRKAANGFAVVTPDRRDGAFRGWDENYVFRTAGELAEWIIANFGERT